MSHNELVLRAKRWLKAIGCRVVISEMASEAGETPDAIGWRYGESILVECKTSRKDFFFDMKKVWRRNGYGMGGWRFYMCEPDLIMPEDVPVGWGLIYTGRPIKIVVGPKGNCSWGRPPFKSNLRRENLLLVSALSRINKKNNAS